MFQVSLQTVQEHLGMAGHPLRCLACGTCPWQAVKQVLIHPEKFVTISWVNIIIFRYLLLSLRANRDPLDSVDKARQILQVLLQWSWLWSTWWVSTLQSTKVLPAWWLKPGSSEMVKLGMLSKWVLQVGSEQGMPRYFLHTRDTCHLLFLGMGCWSAPRLWRSWETRRGLTTWGNFSSASPSGSYHLEPVKADQGAGKLPAF